VSFLTFVEKVVGMDIALFRFINDALYVQWLADATYFVGRDQLILMCLLGVLTIYVVWAGWKKALALGVWGACAVVISNLLHNHLLKLFFNRPRPFMSLDDVHLCVPLNDLSYVSLSFPSTHAASAAALAMLAGCLDARLRYWAFGFALFIGWGTIYSGGHYPADVLAGYGIGVVLGWGLFRISRMLWPREQLTVLSLGGTPKQ
jgi:membrane-associated phospholipid phosphatase